jgi:hypothetical protein
VPLKEAGPDVSLLAMEANDLLIAASNEIVNKGKASRDTKKKITNSARLKAAAY